MIPSSRWLAAVLLLLPAVAAADDGAPVGTWRGTSLCLVKPSACNDETVVYHVTRAAGALEIQADKIVDGKEVNMGTLSCTWDRSGRVMACVIPQKGVFRFLIDADEKRMTGTLTLTDGTLFRKIAADRKAP
jgi:hypothetical protein